MRMTHMRNLERSVNTSESIKVAEQYFLNHGINISVKKMESKNKLLCTYAVFNKNNKNQMELISSGKGLGAQGLASALFEAIEHLIYLDDDNRTTGRALIGEIVNSNKRLLEFYPIYYLSKINYSKEINTIRYTSLTTSINELQYPSFLACTDNGLDSDIGLLKKYKTNSGCASGYSKEEAIIHGINELIERDSLSTHLVDCFIKKSVDTLNVVSPNSLSEKLKAIYYEVEETLEEKITLLEITKYPEFPTYFAYCKKMSHTLPFKGSGTSSFMEYAIERTLLELLQHYHMHDDQNEKEDIITSILFSKYEKYSKAVSCNYDGFHLDYVSLNFSDSHHDLELKDLLHSTIELLNNYHLDVYVNHLYSSDNLYCTKVLIPGLDNFQIINNGVFAIPNNSWSFK